jgi:Tol biopolymer transport system component
MRSEADLDIAIARLDPAGVWREDVLVAGPTRDVLPTWSNDGTHMAFIRTDGFGTPAQANQLMVANADGSSIHAIGDRPIDQYAPCWSPDDLSIGVTSYSSVDLRPVLVLVSMDGAQVEIPVPGRASAACSWQRLAP